MIESEGLRVYQGERYRDVLSRIAFRDWQLNVEPDGLEGAIAVKYYLQVAFDAEDFTGAGNCEQKGRKWLLSPHMTDGEIVQTALMAVVAAVEHEVREEFTYRGHAIFGPHYDLEVLVAVCETGHNEVRRAPTGDPDKWLKGRDHDKLLEDLEPEELR